jgi:DNA-binding NarL/FixJ family response regulator
VLERLVRGASNKAIAANLNVSENTVKTHISHIFAKLGVQSRAEAVAAAIQRGMVSLDRQ